MYNTESDMDVKTDDDGDNLPEFFNVYIHRLSFHRMLIPREFVCYMERRNSGIAELAGPSGRASRVQLVKDAENFYFTDGWRAFVKQNSVREGNFMFFKYYGDLKFSVVIYDESMCEKKMELNDDGSLDGDYVIEIGDVENGVPIETRIDEKDSQLEVDKTEDWIAISNKPFFQKCVLGSYINIPKAFLVENSLSYNSNEKMVLRTSENSFWEVNIKGSTKITLCGGWSTFARENCISVGDICRFELLDRLEMMVHVSNQKEEIRQKKVNVATLEINSLKRSTDISQPSDSPPSTAAGQAATARIMPSSNKPSFTVVLKNYNVVKHFLLEFVEYMGERNKGYAELVRSGKTWGVELIEDGNDLYFADGWKNFVKDNLVRDGEFLFFTLHGDLKFSVVIYDESMCEVDVCDLRGNAVVDNGEEQPGVVNVMAESLQASQQEDQKADLIKPSFVKVVTQHVFGIPKEFVRGHSLNYKSSEIMVLRTSRGLSWKVKIINTGCRIRLSGGWRDFFSKNCFKAGDVCKFELLDRLEMMVHIVDREEGNIEKMVDASASKINHSKSKGTADEVRTVPTRSLRSFHPKFDRTTDSIKPSFEKSVTQFGFIIPKEFVRNNSLSYKDSEKMVLRTSRNSSWDVKIISKDGRIRLSSGWHAFLSENGFNAGDVCKFELMARLEMMVHIVTGEEVTVKKKENVAALKIIPSKRAADGVETAMTESLRSFHPKVDKITDSANPYFEKGITLSSLDIPKEFVHEHSLSYKSSEIMILRTSNNTYWEAKIIQKNDRTFLSGGWHHFFTENCFKVGDIHKFELLNRLEMMVHVIPREHNISKKVKVPASKIIPSKTAAEEYSQPGLKRVKELSETDGMSASVRASATAQLEAELKHLNAGISRSSERRKEVKGILRYLRNHLEDDEVSTFNQSRPS